MNVNATPNFGDFAIPLEEIGLVKREAGGHDARVGYASLTKAGERLLKEGRESAELFAELAFALDPADRAALSGALERLSSRLSTATAAVGSSP